MDGQPGNPMQVQEYLRAHIQEHRKLPESARLRDLGAEKALVQDYSGRVVYELLQNALDRAERHILVSWSGPSRSLEVWNDGRPVTIEPAGGKRSDLKALLSLHTSSKSAEESIGNKGVGFRSVFAAGGEVEVWSRAADDNWWGMRLHHPAELSPLASDWTDRQVASFYAPDPKTEAFAGHGAHVTLIRVSNVESPEMLSNIAVSLRELQRGPLTFLERRAAKGLRLTLRCDDQEVTHTLGPNDGIAIAERRITVPQEVRASTGLDLTHAEVRVLAEARPENSRYWAYLPTEQPAGFGVQVQGDFYVSNSRRNLALRGLEENDTASDPAGWNARLVEIASECIVELWQTPEVCETDHFWQFATPRACTCPHLKDAVARRLWADDAAVFERMVRSSFPHERLWPLERYRRLFEALEAWADYAFRNLQQGPLYKRRYDLLDRLEKSRAPVLPIVTGDATLEASEPLDARPLVAGVQGQRRGTDADRIYFRRHDTESAVELPVEVRRQRTFVTTFSPGLDVPLARQGLLEFERPEILAQLQPGQSPEEHAPLLAAALDLARQEGRGGPGALLKRASELGVGAAWRFVATEAIRRAGESLAGLVVKTCDGDWQPAFQCGRTRGPWPRVDEAWLTSAAKALQEPPSVADISLLLGIGPIPLDAVGSPRLPEELLEETMLDLLEQWEGISGFLRREEGQALRDALEQCRWLRAASGLDILDGVGSGAPYAPRQLWWQYPGRGFTTKLLPRLVVGMAGRPDWAAQLGIVNPQDPTSENRLHLAFQRLRQVDPRTMNDAEQRDLSELYRCLVELLLKLEEPLQIPLLYRVIDGQAKPQNLAWGGPEDGIWHDTGKDTSALRAFTDIRLWAVRKATSLNKVAKLGLTNFAPGSPRVSSEGSSNDSLAHGLHEALRRALPDLVAGACASYNDFDPEHALEAFSGLAVRHFDDVWVEWSFAGRSGSIGKEVGGDVFDYRRADGGGELWFDGERLPLVECAFPLSELLSENRAFGVVFKDALYAWSTADSASSTSVQRFRREHGISDRDVAHWKDRVDALLLDDAARERWAEAVNDVLNHFGVLVMEPALGMVVRPDCFQAPEHATEREIAVALEGAPLPRPRVELLAPNAHRLETLDRVATLAAAAEQHRGKWTEGLLRELKERADTPLPNEAELTQWLDFDPRQALCQRLGVPPDHPAPSEDACAFAKGQIPLTTLPAPPAPLALKRFAVDALNLDARDALSEEDFIRDARRKASGGRRAEDAVLKVATSMALRWRSEDAPSFKSAMGTVLALLGPKGVERAAANTGEAGMRAFLHVADYVGNAGFDVLVPLSGQLLLVEIKRVARLKQAAFFVSDNERRRAAQYQRDGHDWRLWLVAANGETLDATQALARFDEHSQELDRLAKAGLRPGEWLFVLDN